MAKSDTLIISPSGNFYGSEQVLFDFLIQSNNQYTVYVPEKGRFIERLRSQKKHRIKSFGQNVKLFYIKLFWLLCLGKYKNVYINEGGHIRYIKLLASILKKRRFIIHIRISEDTITSRIGTIPDNIILICISQYIRNLISNADTKNIKMIYDPYILNNRKANTTSYGAGENKKIKIGIVGRVTHSKGLKDIETFCDFLENKSIGNIEINLFGDVEKDKPDVMAFYNKAASYKYVRTLFHGFQENKDAIYTSVDVVIHLNKQEPLGRIFLESLDYQVPIIGFREGGIGEIAKLLELDDFMINKDSNWPEDLYNRITHIESNLFRYSGAREKMGSYFSASAYCKQVEAIIA
jgi:glycosyltransferase involved in cell wall biosynthesis